MVCAMKQQQQEMQAQEPPQAGLTPAFIKTQNFKTVLLSEEDIPAFLALQSKVWASLPADEKHFLKVRTAEDLQTHFGYRMPIIGVKDEQGKLVAQCLLAYPTHVDAVRNIQGYPLQGREATTALMQSVAVDPDASGKGLTKMLMEAAKERAIMSGHTSILAKVADGNILSNLSFLRLGFKKACDGTDVAQGYNVTFWQYPLHGCTAAQPRVAL